MSINGNENYRKIDTISGQMSNINVSNGVAVSLTTHSLSAYSAVLNNLRATIGLVTDLTATDLTTTNSVICNGGIIFPYGEGEDASIMYESNDLTIKSQNVSGNISFDRTDTVGALSIDSFAVARCAYPGFDNISFFDSDEGDSVNFTENMCVLFVNTDVQSVIVFLPEVSYRTGNRICVIKRIGSNDLYINSASAGTTIDGSSSNVTISSDYSFVRLIGYVGSGTWYTC